jgi:hypothetical protein
MTLSLSVCVIGIALVSLMILIICSVCVTVNVKEHYITNQDSNLPRYEPEKWNSDINLQSSHNCYAYALNDIQTSRTEECKQLFEDGEETCVSLRPKPGTYAEKTSYDMTCSALESRILADNPHNQPRKSDKTKCPPHYYRIAFAVNPNKTYHFWRQDANGMWSHKDGGGLARDTDDSGKKITSPETADRGQYTEFCGSMCVPKNYHYTTNMES